MNVVIAVTVWLVLGWIGLVFLVATTGRNRRANLPRPSPIDRTRRSRPVTGARPADIRGMLPTTGLERGAALEATEPGREEAGVGRRRLGGGSFGGGDSGGGGG